MGSLEDNIEAINNAYSARNIRRLNAGPPADSPDPRLDDKGRPMVEAMSDRQLLEEMVTTTRATRDLVEAFIADFSKNPMMGMLGGMLGGKRK